MGGGGGWFMLLENKKKFKEFKNLSVKLKKSHHSSISKPHIKFINLNIINVFLSVWIPTVWSMKWLQLTQFQNSFIKLKCVIHDSK